MIDDLLATLVGQKINVATTDTNTWDGTVVDLRNGVLELSSIKPVRRFIATAHIVVVEVK